jgi:hypothetical protein
MDPRKAAGTTGTPAAGGGVGKLRRGMFFVLGH